ncbi:MAG TPA: AGE family epimerase/isomerase [Pseudonocardiaceae bacterium]
MTRADFPEHRDWLAAERRRLLDFAAASRDPQGGFGWLDTTGSLRSDQPVTTWITARMTHVFSLAHGLGDPGAADFVDHGIAALHGLLHDREHGGWYASTTDPTKAGYEHAFVVLAAGSATAAGRPGADTLLAEALRVVETRFWDEQVGLARESWDREWRTTESYRGANSNMHLVEAFLTAGDVTGDRVWHHRALRIAETLIHRVAAVHDWRLPEHFTPDWTPLPDYNVDHPAHPFRPYGGTVGHWLEWARLLLHLEAALGPDAPDWLLPDAQRLFTSAVERGWHADGHPGFVYTLDWQDRPVVRARMHWVIAEAILAAAALHRRTGDPDYARWYDTFWGYARSHHLDHAGGSWHHELDPEGHPAASVWSGKPDVYHAYQAVLFPELPLAPVAAIAVRTRRDTTAATDADGQVDS